MHPLRVVFVANRFWPLVGGREKNLAQLSVELADRGHQVTVWTACWHVSWPRRLVFRGVHVVREADAPRDRWDRLRYLRRLGRWLRNHRGALDVACVSGLREEAYTAARSVAGTVPLVLRADPGADLRPASQPSSEAAPRCCSWRLARACRRADVVIAPFGSVEAQLLAEGYPREKVHRIAPGVRIPRPPSAEGRRAARRALAEVAPALHLADDSPLAVYLGRLAGKPGLVELVTAWSRVDHQFPEARLWLVGHGDSERRLEDHIESRGLSGRVILAGAFDHVDDILGAADWLVQPSPQSGLGMAVLEGMAAGLPVVACDTPEHRELLAHGDCGLLVQPSSAEALASAMLRLAADAGLRQRLGGAGRQRAAAFFSVKHQADHYLALFCRLTAERKH